ncbi:hypothetical protein Tco_0571831 [Tanacetum coccineum]
MISDFITRILEVNQVGSNTKELWIDTSVTRYACLGKSIFSSFKEVFDGAKLFMGNSVAANIKGEGDVILKWTSRKELKLKNVLYIPKIQKNMVSEWLLNKYGFCLAFECNTFDLTKNKMVNNTKENHNGIKKCFLLWIYISLLTKEIGRSSRIDDDVVQEERQRDDDTKRDIINLRKKMLNLEDAKGLE